MDRNPSGAAAPAGRGLADALAASNLEFVPPEGLDGYVAAARRLYDAGRRRFTLRASDAKLALAGDLRDRIGLLLRDAKCIIEADSTLIRPERTVPAGDCDAVFVLETCAVRLSSALMEFVNVPISIVAPITEHYFRRRPCYVITVPKSGTHMLFELLSAFNLTNGEWVQGPPSFQHYHYVSAQNSHTQAADFFASLANRPIGGADHPLFVTPTLFLYRNPLDVVVSEAFYYQDPAKTSLVHYFSSSSMEQRLLQLIGDDPLLSSLQCRIGRYLPWLRLPNVIPLSFEELVGPKGGGTLEEQLKTIWSLQLKLHVPGSPAFYAAAVFRQGTETFRKGAINSHLEHLTEACYAAIRTLNQDFMHELGYDLDDEFLPGYVPRFVDKFRHRPLVLKRPVTTTAKASPPRKAEGCSPNAVYAYRGYLAALTGRLYSAQPQSAPRPVDPRLEAASEHFYVAPSWEELLGMIDKVPLADRQSPPRAVRDMRVDDLFQMDPIPPVQVLADVCGFNVVEFDGRFYCLEQVRGDVNVEWDDTTGIFAARTLDEARAYCEARAAPAVVAIPPARAA